MSEEFDASKEGIVIRSCGDCKSYFVQALSKNRKRLSGRDYPPEEYAALIKGEWEGVLKGRKPKLVGYEIPNNCLAYETVHFLTPQNLGESPLRSYRSELLFWLMANRTKIEGEMPNTAAYLYDNLEAVIARDVEAKEQAEKKRQAHAFRARNPGIQYRG